jgi:MFS family permease
MLGSTFASLRYIDFRFLWMASLSAGAASWALIVARGWLVYDLSGSSVWVGVVTFSAMAPMFLAPPIAGFLADKFDRKKLLAVLFAVQLLHNLVLALLAIVGVIEIWHIIALSFINGCARASQMPAAQALLPNLIPHDYLLNAISLNAATMQGSRLIGPALIVPLMALFGLEAAFIGCTLFYVLSFFFTTRIKTVSVGEMSSQESLLSNFFAGVSFVYKHPLVLPLMVTIFLHCCLTMSFESLLPVVGDRFFHDGGLGASYLMMAVGAGALCLVLVTANIRDLRTRGRFLFLAAIGSGLAPILLGTAANAPSALLGCVLMGASEASYMAIAGAIIQMASPDAIRGRVMSVYLWHIGGMMATFNLVNAALADDFGVAPVLVIAGLAFTASVVISVGVRPLRRLYFEGEVTGK